MTKPRGVLFDYGGVLTGPSGPALRAYCSEAGVDPEDLRIAIFGAYDEDVDDTRHEGAELHHVHALELGLLPLEEFDRRLAACLRTQDGAPPPHEGLARRLFTLLGPADVTMTTAIEVLRAAGVRVGVLSNNWGGAEGWDRADMERRFDVLVLSGEVGLRKPQPEMFAAAVERLGLTPEECVFVDDLAVNVTAAEAVGIRGIVHTSPATTVAALEDLFELPLRG